MEWRHKFYAGDSGDESDFGGTEGVGGKDEDGAHEVNAATNKKKYIDAIKHCVLSELSEENVSLALFGSMAGEIDHGGSDVDIAVIAHGAWNEHKLSVLREKLEELRVPYKVDLVDFSAVSRDFCRVALQKVVWWQQKVPA